MALINLAHYYGKRPSQPRAFPLCTKCRSETNERGIWPGNETLCAHAYKYRNGVLHNEQQRLLGMAFIDQCKFEAMKTLSGWEATHCDEHPFRAKIKVSASTVFELRFEQKS